VMQNGEIVEKGNHKELTKIPDSIYRKLTQLQQIA